MKRDSIFLSDFNPLTRQALVAMFGDETDSGEPQVWAWIMVRCRVMPDMEQSFPKGKWATIQYMQSLLDECAETRIN